MRIGEKCIVVDEMNQGRIKIFADDCLKLAEIQTYIFKRLKLLDALIYLEYYLPLGLMRLSEKIFING